MPLYKCQEYLKTLTKSASFTAYSHRETPGGGGGTGFQIDQAYGIVTHITSSSSSHGTYTLQARRKTTDGWTTLASGKSINVNITNKTRYKYFYFSVDSYTYSRWEDPAGLYYWCNGSVTITYKGSVV